MSAEVAKEFDAGAIEIFRHSLEGIVEEMGLTLQRTAYSTNIKHRRDHTTALFDAQYRHIAQDDIAPQHIGSMAALVPPILEERAADLDPGDGILVNDPYMGNGAIHLPDVFLISPIYYDGEPIGYATNTAHHVDIGGGTPGGIPVDNTDLYGEGIIIPGIKAVRDWTFDEEIIKFLIRNVRGPDLRMGDYRAQLGANRIGDERFRELVSEEIGGIESTVEKINDLLNYTERRVRATIDDLPDGRFEAEDKLDGDGVVDEPVTLKLAVEIDGDEITFDFTGTAPQNKGPLNCRPPIVFSGCIYAVMALFGTNLPKNDGFYRPITLITPEGTMVNSRPQAPVVGGTEMTLRSADLVMKALADPLPEKVIAATKGTVINAAYGGTDPRDDEEYVFYETIAGGDGAGLEKDGLDAVQVHHQDTANSPIETLETEIPLFVRRYELREDSEGAGQWRGGLGLRRDMEFYDHEAEFTILADRSKFAPWGLFGGHSASTARYVINPDGEDETEVGSKSVTELTEGEVVSIQTPGGGGFGSPLDREPEAVMEDVRNEKISIDRAREVYGVAIGPDFRKIDVDVTERLRREMVDATTSDTEAHR